MLNILNVNKPSNFKIRVPTTNAGIKSKNLRSIKVDISTSLLLIIDSATNAELLPKSIILEVETRSVVKIAYLPTSSMSKLLATAAKNNIPSTALNILPALTIEIFLS